MRTQLTEVVHTSIPKLHYHKRTPALKIFDPRIRTAPQRLGREDGSSPNPGGVRKLSAHAANAPSGQSSDGLVDVFPLQLKTQWKAIVQSGCLANLGFLLISPRHPFKPQPKQHHHVLARSEDTDRRQASIPLSCQQHLSLG